MLCSRGTGEDFALSADAEVVEKPAKEETVVENATPDYAAGLVSTQVGRVCSHLSWWSTTECAPWGMCVDVGARGNAGQRPREHRSSVKSRHTLCALCEVSSAISSVR